MAGDDGDGAELAHRAGVAEQDAGEQRPFDVRQRHGEEDLEAARAERQRGFFLGRSLLLHERNHLARDERKGDEQRRQHDARHGEDDLDAVRGEPRPEQALRAEQEHEDQARDDRRHRERQVDQGDRAAFLPRNSNFEITQAAQSPKAVFRGTAIAATMQRQPRSPRARPDRRAPRNSRPSPCASASTATTSERREQEQAQESRPSRRSASSAPERVSSATGDGARRSSSGKVRHGRASDGSRPAAALMASSMTKDIASMIAAIAVAPA